MRDIAKRDEAEEARSGDRPGIPPLLGRKSVLLGMLTSGFVVANAAQPSATAAGTVKPPSITATQPTYIAKWAPSTAYAVGQQVICSRNDVVSANVAHTSSKVYTNDITKWTLSPTFASKAIETTVTAGRLSDQSLAAAYARGHSVKEYGAKGDGTTDDTAAIQSALNAVTQTTGEGVGVPIGNTIWFPAGRYKITSTLNLTRGLRLVGAGSVGAGEWSGDSPGSVLLASTAGMTMVKVDGGVAVIQQGPEFSNICFADKTNNTATLLHMRNVNRWKLDRCTFKDAAVGVRGDAGTPGAGGDCSWFTLSSSVFNNCTTGYQGNRGSSGLISGGDFIDCTYGIDLDGYSAPMKVIAVKMDLGAGCIGIRSKGYANKFIGCDFEIWDAGTGIVFDGDAALYPAPPSGTDSLAMACGFTGHGTGSMGVSVTPQARWTEVVSPRYSNLSTDIADAGADTQSVTNGSMSFGATTGTKIGTAATQKLAFYGARPVVRPAATPAAATDLATALALTNNLRTKLITLGLIA